MFFIFFIETVPFFLKVDWVTGFSLVLFQCGNDRKHKRYTKIIVI